MMKLWLGIDPGAMGAMGSIIEDTGRFGYQVYDYQEIQDGLDMLKYNLSEGCSCRALLEKQQVMSKELMPKQGRVSIFKLAENYGKWQGWLQMLNISYEIITPAKWKKQMFDSMPKQPDKKAMSLDLARRLFPDMKNELKRKRDHNRAEALLLAELARRQEK